MTIEERVKKTVTELTGFNGELNNRMLLSDIETDELDRTNLVMDLEEEFDIGIPDEERDRWVILQDVIDYVNGFQN